MQRTPPKSETLIPASAFTQTTILVETTRARVAVGRINDRVVVLKRFRAATANPDRCPASRRFAAERRYAWTLAADSDFILRPIASVVEAPVMALALPYCKFRSLDLLCRHPLTARWRTLLIADAARGVAHVHACGIILRDVKPGNCLVGDDGVARLADFELAGTAAELRLPAPKYSGGPAGKPRKTFEGTPEYVAPELLEAYDAAPARNSSADPMRAAATFASDVYALAVSANEVASGKAPYDGAERPDAQLQTVLETTYTTPALCRAVVAGRRPELVEKFLAPAFPQLIALAWAADASTRPTAAGLAASLVALGEERFSPGCFEPRGRRDLDALVEASRDAPPAPAPPLAELSAAQMSRLDALGRARSGGSRRRGHGLELAPGPREAMEDAAAAAEWGAAACYVVADGHGGAEAAEVVANGLPRLIGAELLTVDASDDAQVHAALHNAFLRCDEACRAANGGACVVVSLILGDDLFVASAGDCRAVLDRDGDETWSWSWGYPASPDATQGPFAGGVVALSTDHRPADAAETARVTAAGGRTFTLPGETEPRVAARSGKGGLRVTRALGHTGTYPGVVPDPHVVGPVRLSGHDACLTLVTDGVSDQLSDVRLAQILRDTCPEPHFGPKALLVAALDAGADDNVCALVVYLNRHP